MANPESIIQNDIKFHIGRRRDASVWRNNVGSHKLPTGGNLVYGLATGSCDLICGFQVDVTQEMVGQKVFVFGGIEVKTATGRASPEQINFINHVNARGGIAFIARSVEEAQQELDSRVQMMQRGVTLH